MKIPQALVRRAMLSAWASARSRGPDARPVDIALMLQSKYDPNRIHELALWVELARSAVEMVATARDVMNMIPLPREGEVDNAIR